MIRKVNHTVNKDRKPSSSAGFTLVELAVTIGIAAILVATMTGFVIGIMNQFSLSAVRSQLNSDLANATDRLESDIRYSRVVLEDNSVNDTSAPNADGSWHSNEQQLVLGATARDSSGEPLSDDFTSSVDNIVYYTKNGTLYRRLLADPTAGNRYTTEACSGPTTTTGGCPADIAIVDHVQSFNITYYDSAGDLTNAADEAASVTVELSLRTDQSRKPIETSSQSRTLLFSASEVEAIQAGPGIPSYDHPLTSGYGGVSAGTVADIRVTGDMLTYGDLTSSNSYLYATGDALVAHRNCGDANTYPADCGASPRPVRASIVSTIQASSFCAPTSPVVSSSASYVYGSQRTDCTFPDGPALFNKQALVNTIPPENISSSKTCSNSNTSIQANHHYTGNVRITSACVVTLSGEGVIYIEGDLTVINSTLKLASSVKQPITFVVNGKVRITSAASFATNRNVKPNIISFDSSVPSCSQAVDCNEISNSDLYYSRNRVAIDVSNSSANANLYAPFASVDIHTVANVKSHTVFGQSVNVSNSYLTVKP